MLLEILAVSSRTWVDLTNPLVPFVLLDIFSSQLLLSYDIHLNDKPLLGFPFAKLLRNFCGTKRKIVLSLRIRFARKNNNLRNILIDLLFIVCQLQFKWYHQGYNARKVNWSCVYHIETSSLWAEFVKKK